MNYKVTTLVTMKKYFTCQFQDLLFVTVSALLILSATAKPQDYSDYSSEEEDEDWVDWTCQQCSDGAIGVGNYYVQRQVQGFRG